MLKYQCVKALVAEPNRLQNRLFVANMTMPPRDFANFTGKPDATNERNRSIAENRQNVFIDWDVDMPEPTAGVFFCARFERRPIFEV